MSTCSSTPMNEQYCMSECPKILVFPESTAESKRSSTTSTRSDQCCPDCSGKRSTGVGLGPSGLLPHAQYQCPEPQDSPLAALALDRTLLRSPLVTGNSWSELRHAIHIHRSQPAAWRDKEVKSSIISVRMVGDVRVRERRLMLATSQRVPFFLCRKKRILRPKKGEKAVHPFANLRKKKGVVRNEEHTATPEEAHLCAGCYFYLRTVLD